MYLPLFLLLHVRGPDFRALSVLSAFGWHNSDDVERLDVRSVTMAGLVSVLLFHDRSFERNGDMRTVFDVAAGCEG